MTLEADVEIPTLIPAPREEQWFCVFLVWIIDLEIKMAHSWAKATDGFKALTQVMDELELTNTSKIQFRHVVGIHDFFDIMREESKETNPTDTK